MVRSFPAVAVLWAGVWVAGSGGSAAQSPPVPGAGTPPGPAAQGVPGQPGASGESLSESVQALVSAPAVSRAHWGVMVTALDGTPLVAIHEGELFQPASNAKLYTTAAAIALLGPDKTFTTRLTYPAPNAAGVVAGDLVLWGSGDANLNGVDFPFSDTPPRPGVVPAPPPDPLRYLAEFADRIAGAGVREIRGGVIGDDSVFPWEPYPQNWSIDDMVWGFGAPVSGLTVADNELKLTVEPAASAGQPATVALGQRGEFFTLASTALTTPRKTPETVQIDRGVGSRVLRVFGTVPVGHEPVTSEIAITDPAEYAALALRGMLADRGVRVDGAATAHHRVLDDDQSFSAESRAPLSLGVASVSAPDVAPNLAPASVAALCSAPCPVTLEHTSPTVAEDIVYTNKTSQNLHAELLLRQLGKQYGSDGSIAQGVRVVRQFLLNAGLDGKDFVFYDGSGLSGHDLVTPRATAKLLSYAAHDPGTGQPQPWFGQWKASLPVGGVDGSLGGRFKDAALTGHVFAKTGTLGETRALSGYLDCASGTSVIFSIMVDNFVPGTAAVRETVDSIVAAIAAAE